MKHGTGLLLAIVAFYTVLSTLGQSTLLGNACLGTVCPIRALQMFKTNSSQGHTYTNDTYYQCLTKHAEEDEPLEGLLRHYVSPCREYLKRSSVHTHQTHIPIILMQCSICYEHLEVHIFVKYDPDGAYDSILDNPNTVNPDERG